MMARGQGWNSGVSVNFFPNFCFGAKYGLGASASSRQPVQKKELRVVQGRLQVTVKLVFDDRGKTRLSMKSVDQVIC